MNTKTDMQFRFGKFADLRSKTSTYACLDNSNIRYSSHFCLLKFSVQLASVNDIFRYGVFYGLSGIYCIYSMLFYLYIQRSAVFPGF